MKRSFFAPTIALLVTFVFCIATRSQAPGAPPSNGENPKTPRTFPAPKNLKVLPKTMTGEQVHELMEQWEGSLGAKCGTCHTPDPKNIGPNGRPRLNFADDSKPEKATARLMYKMTEDINMNYVSKVESSDAPVTCGTCHRGHLGPEPFVIPPDNGPRPDQSRQPGSAEPK